MTDDTQARIRKLDEQRQYLWSVMGGARHGANVIREYVEGLRKPSLVTTVMAAHCGFDLAAHYRNRLAQKLADYETARSESQRLTAEIRQLQSGKSAEVDTR
ncbi:hypothetical protein [Paraburkholderia sp. MM6662-R1]|uniref:hypothetical protein n=1 Tax=Paraburkholderia sp. MM6662-R1 TaxID=2991066 RepID=UPI003D23F888